VADITMAIEDEIKAKAEAEDNIDTLNVALATAQPMPEPIEDYDDLDYDDDDDEFLDGYVSTPEGKALVERFYNHYENGKPIIFEDEELHIFFKECLLLTDEERLALHERYPVKQK